MRANPNAWMAKRWKETYDFSKQGFEMALWTDKFTGGQFQNSTNPKDGFIISDCKDIHAKRVLEFLISILYLESPSM